MKFPRFVFKDNGPLQRAGGTYDQALVHNEADMAVALEAGWSATLPDALVPKPVIQEPPPPSKDPDNAPPTRAELEAKANELGVQFSPNIGDKKLGERIQEALDALAPKE